MKLKNFIITAIFFSMFVGQDCLSGACCGKETSTGQEKKTVTPKKKRNPERKPLLKKDSNINTPPQGYQTINSSNVSSQSFHILPFEEIEQLKNKLPESAIVVWENNTKQIVIPSFGGLYLFSDLKTAQSNNEYVKDLKLNTNSKQTKDKLPIFFKCISKDMEDKKNVEGESLSTFIKNKTERILKEEVAINFQRDPNKHTCMLLLDFDPQCVFLYVPPTPKEEKN